MGNRPSWQAQCKNWAPLSLCFGTFWFSVVFCLFWVISGFNIISQFLWKLASGPPSAMLPLGSNLFIRHWLSRSLSEDELNTIQDCEKSQGESLCSEKLLKHETMTSSLENTKSPQQKKNSNPSNKWVVNLSQKTLNWRPSSSVRPRFELCYCP